MNIGNTLQGIFNDATNLRKVGATVLIVGAFLFFLQSNLPLAAQTRRLIGMGGTTSSG